MNAPLDFITVGWPMRVRCPYRDGPELSAWHEGYRAGVSAGAEIANQIHRDGSVPNKPLPLNR